MIKMQWSLSKAGSFKILTENETGIDIAQLSCLSGQAHLMRMAPEMQSTLIIAQTTIDHAAYQAGQRGDETLRTEYLKTSNMIDQVLKMSRGEL